MKKKFLKTLALVLSVTMTLNTASFVWAEGDAAALPTETEAELTNNAQGSDVTDAGSDWQLVSAEEGQPSDADIPAATDSAEVLGIAETGNEESISDDAAPGSEALNEGEIPAEIEAALSEGQSSEESEDEADKAEDSQDEIILSDIKEPVEIVAETALNALNAAESKTHSITVSVTNSDGTVSGMYAMDSAIVTEQDDGTYLVRMHQSSVNRDYMALVPDNTDTSKDLATNHTVDWYKAGGTDGYWFVIPVKNLTDTIYASFSKTANVEAGKAWGNVQTITFDTASLAETAESAVTASEMNVIAAVIPSPVPTAVTYDAAPVAEEDVSGSMYVHKSGVDTVYSMFKIESATAVKVDDKIYATIYVNPASSGAFTYSYMYFGDRTAYAAQIEKGGAFDVCAGTATTYNDNSRQAYHFVLPASAENTDVAICTVKSDLKYNSSELLLKIPTIPEGSKDPVPTAVTYDAAPVAEGDVSGSMYVHKSGVDTVYSMFKIESATAVKVDDKIYATIYVNPASSGAFTYSYMYFGDLTALKAQLEKPGAFDVCAGTAVTYNDNSRQAYHFVLPASAEGTDVPICILKSDLTAKSPYNSSELLLKIPTIPEGSKDPTPSATPTPTPTAGDYSSVILPDGLSEANIKVIKEADSAEFAMFKVSASQMLVVDNTKLLVHLETSNVSFDKIYIGSKDAEDKSGYIQGTKTSDGGWSFSFELPYSALGTNTEIALGKPDGTWYSSKTLLLSIPTPATPDKGTEKTDAGMKVLAGGSEVEQMFVISSSSAIKAGDSIICTVEGKGYRAACDRLYLGSRDDTDKTPVITGTVHDDGTSEFTFIVSADKQGTWIPVVAGLKDSSWDTTQNYFIYIPNFDRSFNADYYTDGTYDIYGNAWTSLQRDANKSFPVDTDSVMTVSGDTVTITWVTRTKSFDKLYFGSVSDPDETKDAAAVSQTAYDKIGYGYQYYTITLPKSALGSPIPFVRHTSSKGWDTTQDYLNLSDYLVKVSEAIPTPTPEDTPTPTPAPESKVPDDGKYTANAEYTGTMFRVVSSVLTVKDGKMTARITLSGTGYDSLYMGTVSEAEAAGTGVISYVGQSADGGYIFDIPVTALDQTMNVAAHASKSGNWFQKTVTILSSGLTKIEDETTPTPTAAPTTTPSGKSDQSADKESSYTADASGSTSAVNNSTSLKDGVYTPDSFSFSGGTGKVNITCTKITVTNGQAYATLVFDSSKYGYVKASGNTYYPTVGSGTTTFVIPVELNQNNTIIGMTTAMTQAHEVTYSIFIYLAAASGSSVNGSSASGLISSSNQTLDSEAPTIAGMTYVSETKVEYAEYFRIYNYQDGIVLLEIDTTRDTARDPEKKKAETEESSSKDSAEKTETSETSAETEEADTYSDDESQDETTSASVSSEDTAKLYLGNVVKYLIVPEDTEVPVGLSKDMIVIQLDKDESFSAYLSSVAALGFMDELDQLDLVSALGVSTEDEDEKADNADTKEDAEKFRNNSKKLAELTKKLNLADDEKTTASDKTAKDEKTVVYAGLQNDPDYRQIVKSKINLAIFSEEILPDADEEENEADDSKSTVSKDTKSTSGTSKTTVSSGSKSTTEKPEALTEKEQEELLQKVTEKFALMDIPVIFDRSQDEKTDLAKYEWIKVYGALFGESDQADKLFQAAVKAADKK